MKIKNLIIGATILVAISAGTLQAQEDRSIDYGAKYRDAYWAKRGYYRNDYGTAYYKGSDKRAEDRFKREATEQVIKSEPAEAAAYRINAISRDHANAPFTSDRNSTAEVLFAQKMANLK
jgi:hypothetical protein